MPYYSSHYYRLFPTRASSLPLLPHKITRTLLKQVNWIKLRMTLLGRVGTLIGHITSQWQTHSHSQSPMLLPPPPPTYSWSSSGPILLCKCGDAIDRVDFPLKIKQLRIYAGAWDWPDEEKVGEGIYNHSLGHINRIHTIIRINESATIAFHTESPLPTKYFLLSSDRCDKINKSHTPDI